MTIIHNKNIISTTIGELSELMRVVHVHHGDQPETIINIEIDEKGNGIVSSPPLHSETPLINDISNALTAENESIQKSMQDLFDRDKPISDIHWSTFEKH